jgi:hypothetical protein
MVAAHWARATAVALALIVLINVQASDAGDLGGIGTPECMNAEATIVATPGQTVVTGTPGADVIVGSDDLNEIDGLGGDDAICGRGGRDSATPTPPGSSRPPDDVCFDDLPPAARRGDTNTFRRCERIID